MKIYISSDFWGDYHPNFPITRSNRTNGVRTRMHDLHYALRLPIVTEIAEERGDLLIDPFAVKPRDEDRDKLTEDGWTDKAWNKIENGYVDEVCEYNRGNKYILCTEMEFVRWRGEVRDRIMRSVKGAISVCNYQKDLFKVFGVESNVLPEPISEMLFYPTEKKPKQIVSVGGTNHVKNTKMIIDLYKSLEGKGYHRVYVGGPTVWGRMSDLVKAENFRYNMDLYYELKEVCDEFHEASPRTVLARILSESEFYVNFAYHEVACRTMLEALMSGCGVIWGRHPLGEEYPVLCSAASVEEAVGAIEKYTGVIDVPRIRKFALKRHSFISVKEAFEEIMYEN